MAKASDSGTSTAAAAASAVNTAEPATSSADEAYLSESLTQAAQSTNSLLARGNAEASYKRLRDLIKSYPADTPNEHVLFGYGAVRITLGDFRALFQ